IGGLVLYTEVVTEAVEARRLREAAEAQYRAIFDQVAVGVARIGLDGRYLEMNDRYCAITRYSREELLTRSVLSISHPEDMPTADEIRALVSGDAPNLAREKRYVSAGGEVVWVNLTLSLVRRAGELDYFVSVIEDIAPRKAAEALQQRYQDQLRLL